MQSAVKYLHVVVLYYSDSALMWLLNPLHTEQKIRGKKGLAVACKLAGIQAFVASAQDAVVSHMLLPRDKHVVNYFHGSRLA